MKIFFILTIFDIAKANGDVVEMMKLQERLERVCQYIKVRRIGNVKNALTSEMIMGAMNSLTLNCDEDLSFYDNNELHRLTLNMLYDMALIRDSNGNLDVNDNRTRNICLSDIKRGTIKIYERDEETDLCRWVIYDKEGGLQKINEYAKQLFCFLLETGTSKMKFLYWDFKYNCLAWDGGNQWSVIIYFNDHGKPTGHRVKTEQLKEPVFQYDKEEYPEHLRQIAINWKDKIIEQFEDIILRNSDLLKYLGKVKDEWNKNNIKV